MANNIELITLYSPKAWDTVYKQESRSSLLDVPSEYLQFTGAKTVKIAKFQAGGLHDYFRNNVAEPGRVPANPGAATYSGANFVGSAPFGYQKSAATLVWQEFTLRCDRGAAFQIEKFDNEESGGKIVGTGVTEISRTIVIPEVDAYTFSTIASYCSAGLGNLVAEDFTSANTTDKPLAALNKAFTYMAKKEVNVEDQIVFASPDYVNALRSTNEVTKFLAQEDYNKDIKFTILKYNGREIVEVAPNRFRTDIQLFGQEGYSWGADSKAINYLMVAKSAIMHVVKYEKVKVIGDDLNLAGNGFDGYTIYTRVYHDVFVPENKRIALYCSVEKTASPAPALVLDVLVKNGKVAAITTDPGEKLVFVVTSTDTGTSVGGTLTNYTMVNRGDAVTATTKFYAIDSNKKILAIYEHTVATTSGGSTSE